VCVCVHLILAPKEEEGKETTKENGLIIRSVCSCVCVSVCVLFLHCLQSHKVEDVSGKIGCNNIVQEDSFFTALSLSLIASLFLRT